MLVKHRPDRHIALFERRRTKPQPFHRDSQHTMPKPVRLVAGSDTTHGVPDGDDDRIGKRCLKRREIVQRRFRIGGDDRRVRVDPCERVLRHRSMASSAVIDDDSSSSCRASVARVECPQRQQRQRVNVEPKKSVIAVQCRVAASSSKGGLSGTAKPWAAG
jgi:hypothetical protein